MIQHPEYSRGKISSSQIVEAFTAVIGFAAACILFVAIIVGLPMCAGILYGVNYLR